MSFGYVHESGSEAGPAPRRGGPRDPARVLAELLAGNERFVQGRPRYGHDVAAAAAVAGNQEPDAVVVGCMDSRVPLEAIFDQTFGAICVVRTAGHVLDQAVWGSIEFAVGQLGVPLVVVLGHERCGAVAAAVEAVRTGRRPGGAVDVLVDEIAPAVAEVGLDSPDIHARALRAHIRSTVRRVRAREGMAPGSGDLAVVGAVYNLDTGRVDVLEGLTA